ncbi:retinol dehydrogenase 7-like [Epinephelus lanceolatus]
MFALLFYNLLANNVNIDHVVAKLMDIDLPCFSTQVSTDHLMTYLLEVILSHLALTCASLLATLAVIRWYIRDSCKVDGFNQKHVFITGCDSGFGNLLARQLDGKCFHVIAACLTEKGATDLAAAASPRLKTLLLAVTDSVNIRRAVEFVSEEVRERGLWGLVNNAGRLIPFDRTEWMQLEDFSKVLDVNLIGLIDVTLQFLPLLKKSQGRVVNMTSLLGRVALIGGGYCLSKFGVEAFSDSLRRDMQHFGIKVSIIEPGFFKTDISRPDAVQADLRRLWTHLPQDAKDSYGDTFFDDYVNAKGLSMGVSNSDLSKVTRCMEHALTARFPRTRYSAGFDAKFIWIPLSYFPSFVTDFIVVGHLSFPKNKRNVS